MKTSTLTLREKLCEVANTQIQTKEPIKKPPISDTNTEKLQAENERRRAALEDKKYNSELRNGLLGIGSQLYLSPYAKAVGRAVGTFGGKL